MKKLLLLTLCLGVIKGSAQTLYPSGVTNCIARYDFATAGQTITALNDVSGNNNNSSVAQNLSSAPGWRNKPNKAMLFNGTSSYALIPNSSSLTPNAVTMVALVKMNGYYNGACQTSQILCKGAPGYISGQYGIGITDDQFDNDCNSYSATHQQLIGYFYNSYYTTGMRPPAGNYVNTNDWFFVAISFDGSQVNYYQAIMDSNNHLNNLAPFFSSSNFSSALGSNTQDISIGKHLNPPYPYWFNGKMDEVVLFNKVLTNTEIQSVYDYLWEVFSVNSSFTNTTLCLGSTFQLPVTVKSSNTFGASNIMTAQLSDANGSFASPTIIGTASLAASGNISCTIPSGLSVGTGYKIRLVSSAPYQISEVFESNISIIATAPAPTVSVSVSPSGVINAGQSVTFTATAANAGPTPTYQWLKNGNYVSGATSATYTTNTLSNNDVISVRVKSSYSCASPDSIRSIGTTITVKSTGISTVSGQSSNYTIYPNPTSGSFVIKGHTGTAQTTLSYQITNAVGQVVLTGRLHPLSGELNEEISLPSRLANGVYIMSLSDIGEKEILKLNLVH